MPLTAKHFHEAACNVADQATGWPQHHAYSCNAILEAVGDSGVPLGVTKALTVKRLYAGVCEDAGVPGAHRGNGFVPVNAFAGFSTVNPRTYKEANDLRFIFLLLLAESL